MQNQLISEDWRFLYVFFVEIVTSNMDLLIAQIKVGCSMPFGNCFLIYVTWEFDHCYSNVMKQDFLVIGWVLLFLFLLHNFNFVDYFCQDKLCPNMRIRFDLKGRKDRRKWRGIAGSNLGKGK